MANWINALRLNERREVVDGSVDSLAAAVKRGATLRSYTTFDYAEHMSAPETPEGLVQESMSFSTVYWLEGGHVAGIQTTRYPANAGLGFGDNPSMSFFLNNDNGRNGVGRFFLDGRKGTAKAASYSSGKYRVFDQWDVESAAPSENFEYDFGEYAWWVDDSWEEVLAHEADGSVTHGSLQSLQEAFRAGRTLKVGVRDLFADLAPAEQSAVPHEVFVELHSVYNHADSGFLGGESQPIVRVAPSVPMRYRSGNWNCGWILPRTDGVVHQLIVDPLTRSFSRREGRFAIRWFIS